MTFNESIESLFSQYATFRGRARRSELWYAYLFVFLVNFAMLLLIGITRSRLFTALYSIWNLASLVPMLAVAVRRLHDLGKSGLYYLFILIPFVGAIILIVWFCQDSQPGSNMYGPNPKGNYGYGAAYRQNPYGQNPYQQNPYGQYTNGQNFYRQYPNGQNTYRQVPAGRNTYRPNSNPQNPYGQNSYNRNSNNRNNTNYHK